MKSYIVYFEVYDKKMKTKVLAKDANEAQEIVVSNIKFLKTVLEEDTGFIGSQDAFNYITDIFSGKK